MESCFCVVIFYYYNSYWAFGLFRLPFNVCISFGVGWSKILQDQLLSRLNLSGLSLINNFDANYNTQTQRHTRRWSHRTSDRESHWAHENCLLLHSLIHTTTTTMRVQRTMTIDDLFFLFLIFIFFFLLGSLWWHPCTARMGKKMPAVYNLRIIIWTPFIFLFFFLIFSPPCASVLSWSRVSETTMEIRFEPASRTKLRLDDVWGGRHSVNANS